MELPLNITVDCRAGIHMDSESVQMKGNVPIDLLIDILLRLPAKAIGRCMCTCKTWYSLIKSTEFMTSHFNRSKNRDHSLLILQEGCYSIFSEFDTTLIKKESGRIPFPVVEKHLYMLGSCRGLVLVRFRVGRDWQVLLWNPSLEKTKLIDTIIYDRPHGRAFSIARWMCTFALGFHEATNDYRVVRIDRASEEYYPEVVVHVYSFRKDKWHRLDATLTDGSELPIIAYPQKLADFVNGAVHWLATTWDDVDEDERFVILSFDFDNEVFKVIELPNHYVGSAYTSLALELKELNGKLALLDVSPDPHEFYCMWVMMNYPLVESWTNIGCSFVESWTYIGCLFEHEGKHGLWPVVCTKKENCVLRPIPVDKRDMLRYYNAKEDKMFELEVATPCRCPVIVDFVDCLVLLDDENEVLEEDHTP